MREPPLESDAAARPQSPADKPWATGGFLVVVVFTILVWFGFSDKRDLFHILCGVFSAILVAALTHWQVVQGVRRNRRGRLVTYYLYDFGWHRLLVFAPWLVWKIAAANFQVAMLILRPAMPIDPRIVRVRIDLEKDVSRMAMAAAITLTPGTCVLDINGPEFVIHCIHPSSAEDIHSGSMLAMVRWTFEPAPRSSRSSRSAVASEGSGHA
jgi:multisubunit Na+/H+ antiporter MnhE subunit